MTYVYAFDQCQGLTPAEATALLGGKAANLSVMATELGLPVPPGFTLTTALCDKYLAEGWPAGLDAEIRAHMARVEQVVGRRFGDPADPLLVSVRSGAPVSMPGMMDTILNLGLNEATAAGLAAVSGDAEFAANCHERFKKMFREIVGVDVAPEDPWEQLRAAAEAVFRSWNGDRARAYRKHEDIPDDLGTAVTIQTMVFGNRGNDSATGVLFTRNAATGVNELYGDVMFDAQGEDVVAGAHATQTIADLDERLPAVAAQLRGYAHDLERHFRDMCDIEFTVEQGKLWMLQVRVGKASPQAALRIAIDMAEDQDFPLTREEAVRRVARYLEKPPRGSVRRPDGLTALTTGLAASPGVASGEVVTSADAAVEAADAGRRVILVRAETSPEDVHGMGRAAGVLTASGGFVSHAAVVARGWGIPAVVGARAIHVGNRAITIGDRQLSEGETITIDGSTGEVFAGGQGSSGAAVVPEVETLLSWAAELGIVANRRAEPTGDDVVRTLLVKGQTTVENLAQMLLADPAFVEALLAGAIVDGAVEQRGGDFRLTADGKLKAGELIAVEREMWGAGNSAAALEAFVPFDHRMKAAVTAWQMKSAEAFNDHADPEYDAGVLAELGALHSDTSQWLAALSGGLPRLDDYRVRLGRALELARGGNQMYVASPRVESYHTVWFELHEDLIRISGRKRADEVAAGRA